MYDDGIVFLRSTFEVRPCRPNIDENAVRARRLWTHGRVVFGDDVDREIMNLKNDKKKKSRTGKSENRCAGE